MRCKKKLYLSQVVRKLDLNTPVLYWDTCGLLEIFYLPMNYSDASFLQKFENLADAIADGRIQSVMSEVAVEEFDNHYQDALGALKEKQEDAQKVIKNYAKFMSDSVLATQITSSIDRLEVAGRLENVLGKICRNTCVIKADAKQRSFADYRLRHKLAPAAKKNEYKDCLIWGCFTFMSQRFPDAICKVFFTKNKDDFEQNNSPYPILEHDCIANHCELVLGLGELWGKFHRLGLV